MNNTYDLIFSLGGSCATASQLNKRGLRFCSLPLDYVFFSHSGTAIRNLADAFDNGFQYFLLKENLRELKGDERGQESDKMQYIDTATQYKWIHHFLRPIGEAGSYNQVKEKIDRRIKRLLSFLAQSNRVLAILDTAFDIETEHFQYLSRVINKHYPALEFHMIWLRMNAKETAIKQMGNLTVYYTQKPVDLYDFEKTNFCWSFMDELSLSGKFNTNKPGPISTVIIRILTAFIPIKSIRKKYRNRLLNGNTRNNHD